jgi:hypothetical protein
MLALVILAKILKRYSEKSENLLRTLRFSGFAPLVKPNYATPGHDKKVILAEFDELSKALLGPG